MSATDDVLVARARYAALIDQGVKGIVAERAGATYRPGRSEWQKIRDSETVDADVVGYAGSPARSQHLAVQLPDGRIALTQTLPPALAATVAPHLTDTGPSSRARTTAEEGYARGIRTPRRLRDGMESDALELIWGQTIRVGRCPTKPRLIG